MMDPATGPRPAHRVMVSSTFTDLQQHRQALCEALLTRGFKPECMEHSVPTPGVDVISSSLQMVRDSAAYLLIISHRYGQIPPCPDRNPQAVSITELEFNEAQRLRRPTLVFLIHENHPTRKADIESDPIKGRKLAEFRERAMQDADSKVHRVYTVFESLEHFSLKATEVVATLSDYLERQARPVTVNPVAAPVAEQAQCLIPPPPALYAAPPYIGSHAFITRSAPLGVLDDWAAAADPDPVLLFDAIGGAGKSLLTWHWINQHAPRLRSDWAGRFWYSFYERGAVMAEFCRHALAYITGEPLQALKQHKTPVLADRLLQHLRQRPWLLVLDGLERVLVAYHRIDAAELADAEAHHYGDQIARRDPCSAIRPEDDDLLRSLVAAAPSKVLVTSRLVPRVLLNPASQGIAGVRREPLHGMRPLEAEQLLRACHVQGDSAAIQRYLQEHCGNHPLVIGVLAGLINDYLPDRGNFDAWVQASSGGAGLTLASLDLIQRRNHILEAAIASLPDAGRRLLNLLSLLSEAVDYEVLLAINPHLPPAPDPVPVPEDPRESSEWQRMSEARRRRARQQYQADVQRHRESTAALELWPRSTEVRAAPGQLDATVRDLERRGLLQYEHHSKRYDLHPVVRGVVAGRLPDTEKHRDGQRVVDHFAARPGIAYEQATTLEDVGNGLHLVRTLLKLGRYQQACDVYQGDLALALLFNLEAHTETLSLLRPFFPRGWDLLPEVVEEESASYLLSIAASALGEVGETATSLAARGVALMVDIQAARWRSILVDLHSASSELRSLNHLAKAEHCVRLALDLSVVLDDKAEIFMSRLFRFDLVGDLGRWDEADAEWQSLDSMGRDWPRHLYCPGAAEGVYVMCQFFQGTLQEAHLMRAEQLAVAGNNRAARRGLHHLRGLWRLHQREWALAATSLHEAVSMARAAGIPDSEAQAWLAFANFQRHALLDSRGEAERLSNLRVTPEAAAPTHLAIATLWQALGEPERALQHAHEAYRAAWADGEPYVRRYWLDRARALLEALGAAIPQLPAYDPAQHPKLPWEDQAEAAIEKLRAEMAAKLRPPS